jgi:hypothetical protein
VAGGGRDDVERMSGGGGRVCVKICLCIYRETCENIKDIDMMGKERGVGRVVGGERACTALSDRLRGGYPMYHATPPQFYHQHYSLG